MLRPRVAAEQNSETYPTEFRCAESEAFRADIQAPPAPRQEIRTGPAPGHRSEQFLEKRLAAGESTFTCTSAP